MTIHKGHERPFRILLVDDDPDSVLLMQKALQKTGTPVQTDAVFGGDQAMDFLGKRGRYAASSRPDLILLDLNMPGKDGREVLSEAKADPSIASIPIIVMSSSCSEEDVAESYRRHANSFIEKPMDLSGMFEIVEALEKFWINTAKLPARGCHEENTYTSTCDRR